MNVNAKQEAEPDPEVKVPKELIPINIGKVVEVSAYRKHADGVDQKSFEHSVGKLKAFWHNKDNMIIQLDGLPTIMLSWGYHLVIVTVYGKNLD